MIIVIIQFLSPPKKNHNKLTIFQFLELTCDGLATHSREISILVAQREFWSFNYHQYLSIVCSASFGRPGRKERVGSAISLKTATKATLSWNQRKGRRSCGTTIFWTKTQVHKCVRLFFCFLIFCLLWKSFDLWMMNVPLLDINYMWVYMRGKFRRISEITSFV